MVDYLQNIKNVCDNLAAAGEPVFDTDLIVHILNGLPSEFDSFATSIRVRETPVTPDQLHGLLLTEELTIEHKHKNQDSVTTHAFASLRTPINSNTSRPGSSPQAFSRGRGRTNFSRGR